MSERNPSAASGTLTNIWIKRFKRGPMDPVDNAKVVADRGLVGNANQGGHRQVTLVAEEKFEAMSQELGATIEPIWRRGNLLVRGVELTGVRDKVLRVGKARLLIHGETNGCHRMDEAFEGLRAVMKELHGGGAYGEVLEDAEIQVGDPVFWEEEA